VVVYVVLLRKKHWPWVHEVEWESPGKANINAMPVWKEMGTNVLLVELHWEHRGLEPGLGDVSAANLMRSWIPC